MTNVSERVRVAPPGLEQSLRVYGGALIVWAVDVQANVPGHCPITTVGESREMQTRMNAVLDDAWPKESVSFASVMVIIAKLTNEKRMVFAPPLRPSPVTPNNVTLWSANSEGASDCIFRVLDGLCCESFRGSNGQVSALTNGAGRRVRLSVQLVRAVDAHLLYAPREPGLCAKFPARARQL